MDARSNRNRRRSLAIFAVVWLVLAAGCGGSASGPAVRTRYPEAQYLVATGESSESQAQAEARARAALAAQIRSQIRSVLEDQSRQASRDGVISTESTTRSSIRQEAEFGRMELMRVDEASRRRRGGVYQATVYLDRAEARPVLQADYTAAAELLVREAASLDAVADDDLPGFAAHYALVRQAYAEAEARAMELRAVAGAIPVDFFDLRRIWFGAADQRQRRLDGLRLAVVINPPIPAGDPLDLAALREQVVAAVGDLGLVVRGRTCDDAPYLLVVQPRLWHKGMLGVESRLTFTGHLRDCRAGHRWEINLADPAWVADGARAEEAVRKLQMLVDAASLRPHLVEALADLLPLR
ncbi:MAG: hypothetical protein R3D98_04450 [Candidatus Krumholzibacteriia bacterium]